MTARCYLAIDAGTGSARAVLFDDTGREIAAAQQEWWHQPDPRFEGSMDFDVGAGWDCICSCVREAIERAGIDASNIAGVSSTSMREAIVLFDREGRELWACANVDSRANEEVRWLREHHDELETELYARTGQTYALGALPRLLWVSRHLPELYASVHRIGMLSDWILFKLSGELSSEPSNAGTTGLLSLESRSWLTEPLERLGLKADIFPRTVATGERVGVVTTVAASATGLPEGTPVVAGGGDCQIGTLGLGLAREGECAVLGGTFWQQVVNMPPGLTDPSMDLRINPHVVPTLVQAEAISFFVGAAMRWFRDSFGEREKAQGDAYAKLEARSREVPPGAYGIVPIFSDAMHYGAWYHAAPSLLNLSLDPERSGKAAIFRAMQENAAIVAHRNLQAVFALTGRVASSIVFAGGASRSTHWSQILADVTGLPVQTPIVKEATALGCAMAAATGTGQFDSLEAAARAWAHRDREHLPRHHLKALYDEAGERWSRAYALQKQLVDEGVTTPMWKAPGL